jgi:hypothetical protein
MRGRILILGLMLILALALIGQAVWDNAITGWAAFGLVFVVFLVRVLAAVPGMPDWWPFIDDGDL